MVAGKEQMIQSNSLQIDGGFSLHVGMFFFLLSSISRLDVTLSFHDARCDPNPIVLDTCPIHMTNKFIKNSKK